jgi:hypothetical protein
MFRKLGPFPSSSEEREPTTLLGPLEGANGDHFLLAISMATAIETFSHVSSIFY